MIALPIVERELRVAARRPGTYWSRLAAALIALVLLIYLLFVLPGLGSRFAVGAAMFRALSYLSLAYVLLVGVRITSDCLSEEKREGTLGLLFLTDLKSHDVVLGKLAATSINGFYALLAILPVLAIPILMGGVSATDFWRTALVLINAMFFSLTSGLFVSSISRVARKAAGGTLLLLLIFNLGLPIAGGFLGVSNGREYFLWCSPWYPVALTPGLSAGRYWSEFWGALAGVHAFGWLFLFLTCIILPRIWQDKPAVGKIRRAKELSRNVHLGNAAERKAFRARALAVNPLFWLGSRVRLARTYPWIFLMSISAIWLWGWSLDHYFGVPLALGLSYVTHLFFKVWVAGTATQCFAVDRDQGALELLFSTPLTVKEMIHGQWLALWHQFARPALALVALDLLLIAGTIVQIHSRSNSEGEPLLLAVTNTVVFVVDLFALGWWGMWNGVTHHRAQNAAFRTVINVLALPWLAVLLLVFFVAIGTVQVDSIGPFVICWAGASLVLDVVFIQGARRSLQEELRVAATQRFSRVSSGKGRWFSKEAAG